MTATERLEAIAAAKRDPEGFHIAQADLPHGREFAATVGRFQEGFLSEGMDFDAAFARAVETAARLLPAIIAKAA